MILVGCDLHARKQQVVVLDSETGEVQEVELCHQGDAIEQFYAALPRPVTVAVESTGYALWFHALMRKLGHTLLVGDAAKIRAMVVRKTKTDRRDALHPLDLLKHDRLPAIWVPDPATRDLRALLAHRMRLVRMRTMAKNRLHAIALSYRLVGGSRQLTRSRLVELQRLALPVHTGHRRDESLELLGWLNAHIRQLDDRVAEAANGDPGARQLLTHPGVGAVTALTTVLVLGPVRRFPSSKEVASYVGLAPSLHASADKRHLGQITKQGNALLRMVLVQAAAGADMTTISSGCTCPSCAGADAPKREWPWPGSSSSGFIMLRDRIDYEEFCRRGRTSHGPQHPVPA